MNERTVLRSRLIVGLAFTSVLALSCASPNKLAQQSEKAYGKGEVEKAYQKAAHALRKEPENRRARAAMTQAAARLMDERETEIRGLAVRDTVAAAKRSLALDSFRAELTEYRIVLPASPAFDQEEEAIRLAAAEIEYREGGDDLEQGYPKRAYGKYQMARSFQPHYRDIARRIQQAYDEAQPRLALLPFTNETDLGSLSKGFADRAYVEIARRTGASDFRFTDLIARERVYEAMPVVLLDHMSRREAARIGRQLGADRVIVGRFYGLRTNTNTGTFTQPVFYKTVDKDEKGATRERYVERTLDILTRDREVSVGYEYQVIDVEDGSPIAGNNGTLRAAAHAIYTSAPVDGDADDYCLVPPDIEKSDGTRAKRIYHEWEDHCGDWKLPDLITRSRKERSRSYESRYGDDWALRANSRGVFLGDVPPEGDLVKPAFCQVWDPLVRTLLDLDQSEPRQAGGSRP